MTRANSKYLSVNWNSSGGGAFAVIPLEERGKLPDLIPLFRGHTATVLDTDWNPFDDQVIASSSDDGAIAIWRIADNYTLHFDDPEEIKDITPIKKLIGHTRKVGHILFHPVASDILASASNDYTIKIWNIETGENLYTLPHKDLITSFSFNHDGSLLATVSRDKTIRIWDIRAEKVIQEGPGHTGAKASKVVWLGDKDRIVTTGFSKLSDRQYALWNTNDIAAGPIGGFIYLDGSSGSCFPYYDDSTNCLYLSGKGDGNVRYFEFENDDFFPLSEYMSSDPQRGMAFLPKRAVNMHEHEVVRFFKSVNDSTIEPISFIVPRRAETFQDDIYPPAYAGEPSLTAEEWVSGKNSPPKVISLEAVFNGQKPISTIAVPKPTPAPVEVPAPSTPKKTVEKKVVTPEPEKPKSTKLDDVLGTSNEVNSLLNKAKNAEDVAIPKALEKEESSWDAEPVPTKRPSPPPSEPVKPVEKKETPKPAAEPKKELPPKFAEVKYNPIEEDDFEEITVVKKEPSPSATPVSVSKVASSTPKSTSSSPVASNNTDAATVASLTKKLENLESKFEKLLSVVERLEGGQSKILDLLNSK
ncbi:hypothetical protein D0Z00_000927 [Geotrichum galactomycetum]|uniref:Uncharacterized protein n=1 Tax=Geotrichum galactomycetum TaxID=27317 RepID=A0ACB6V8C0_9ASCO|nr:hypothetical protein D0Z00_000927 [Geotrichum candidum]